MSRSRRPLLALEVRDLALAPRALVAICGLPLTLLVLFADRPNYRHVVLGRGNVVALITVQIALYAAATAMASGGARASVDRARGWLRALRVAGLSAGAFLGIRLLGVAILTTVACVTLDVVGLALGARLPVANWLASDLVLLVASSTFGLLGVAMGLLVDADAANQLAILGTVVLLFLGGVFVPTSAFPHWLSTLARYTPANAIVVLADRPFYPSAPVAVPIATVLGWTLVFALIVRRSYRHVATRGR